MSASRAAGRWSRWMWPVMVAMAVIIEPCGAQVADVVADVSRFSAAPPAGVHPRILISPQDLPALRRRLETTACGRRAISSIRVWLDASIHREGKPLFGTYRGLVDGDPEALSLAENDWWANNVSLALCLESFDALVREDAQRGRDVAAALVTYAELGGGTISPHGHKSVNPDYLLGLAYDFAHGFMTDPQRDAVRNVIARTTTGRRSHGMDMPPHQATYNFMSHGTQLMLMALAIEGEAGYDPTIYPATVELMRNFLTHGIYPSGTPTEGMHYYNFGMSFGALSMAAMARRGDDLFNHPHYLATRFWYVHSIEPFGYRFSMHDDTPTDNGGLLPNYALLKWVLPEDPIVDDVWRNRVQDHYGGISYRSDLLAAALFPSDWRGGDGETNVPIATQWGVDTDAASRPAASNRPLQPESLQLPMSHYTPQRGFLISRSDWSPDALVLHFESRPDITGPHHAHSDRNGFILSALGRKWAIDRGMHISETQHHSCVLIDGKGQGFFGPPGRIVAYQESPHATIMTGDAAYAYRYRYTFGNRVKNAENKDDQWEPETLPQVVRHLSRTQDPHDRPWETNPMYTHRAIENPVRYAFRTAALVRGPQPYVLIIDDIQKDDAPHRYEWLMQLPDDVVAESVSEDRMILAPAAADAQSPRLLVQVLEMTSSDGVAPLRLETYEMARSPRSGMDKRFGQGKRVVLASRSVEPRFKVLLWPFRPGTPMPDVRREDAAIRIAWPDQADRWTFERGEDRRSIGHLSR